jgi:hypothetical protein
MQEDRRDTARRRRHPFGAGQPPQHQHHRELAVVGRDQLAHDLEHRRQPGERERHRPGEHVRADGVQPEIEPGDDSEVPTAAARPPQQVRVVGVDLRAAQLREVEHEPVVADRQARDVVAAAAHGDAQVPRAGEREPCHDVGGPGAAHDRGRAPVDRGVPDGAGGVVAGVHGRDHLPGDGAEGARANLKGG